MREKHVRVLLTGATGLIGSAVFAALRAAGHEVVAVVHSARAADRLLEPAEVIALDMARAITPHDWLRHLAGIDAIVNCAGVLQDSPRDSAVGVHVTGAAALFQACEQAGVRRVVHVSALGVDRGTTAFARTKLAGDEALMARKLDWVILRPSVVVGRTAYGASALFRGLAALPVMPRVPETRPLQVVQLDDLARTIVFFLSAEAPARLIVEIVGPERLSLEDILITYRRWLGRRDTRSIHVPLAIARAVFRLGDLIGLLGWRPPLRSTALLELARGVVGDANQWTRITGIKPRSLRAALAAEPASVQERWFARLYFLKPVALGVLALCWIITGLLALGPSRLEAVALLAEAGLGATGVLVGLAASADIAVGIAIAVRRWTRPALYAGLTLSVAYLLLGSLLLPRLWVDPLGPLLKVAPILVLNLIALAILDER